MHFSSPTRGLFLIILISTLALFAAGRPKAEETEQPKSASSKKPFWVQIGSDEKVTPLHRAACEGDVENIKKTIAKGADLNAVDEYERTPLHCAIEEGNVEAAILLVDSGADIEKLDQWENSPLMVAIDQGNLEIARMLLASGANVNHRKPNGEGPIHKAAESRSLEMVKLIVEGGADVNATYQNYCGCVEKSVPPDPSRGTTALHIASRCADENIAGYLLEQGAEINAKDIEGRTPVRVAVEDADRFDYCHVSGAAGFKLDRTLRDFLAYDNFLIGKGAHTDIFVSSALGRTREVNNYLREDPSIIPWARDDRGRTPLHFASYFGRPWVVSILLSEGAYVNASAEQYEAYITPIHAAAANGDSNTVNILLKHGAAADPREYENSPTPMLLAASRRDKDGPAIILSLFAAGASVNSHDKLMDYPIHAAAANGSLTTFRLLLSLGADPEARDRTGRAPLHLAVNVKNPLYYYNDSSNTCQEAAQKTELLLARRADPNAKDDFGSTPIFSADCTEVREILVSHGAEVNSADKMGNSSLTSAINNNELEDVKFLISNGADPCTQEVESSMAGTNSEELFHFLFGQNCGFDIDNLFIAAVGHKNFDRARFFLKKGADINAGDQLGFTALHDAWDLETVNFLLENGANVNARAKNGLTPLHLEVCRCQLSMATTLLNHGADVCAVTDYFKAPDYLAGESMCPEMGPLLIQYGAETKCKDKPVATPIENPLSLVPAEAGDYAVYSAIINETFAKEELVEMIVVDEETTKYEGFLGGGGGEKEEFREGITKSLANAKPGLIDAYFSINNESFRLGRFLSLSKPYELDSFYDTSRYFYYCGHHYWQRFYLIHPNAPGSTWFSRVGFSSDGTQALVYVGNQREGLWGSGNLLLLENTGEGWKIIGEIKLWVS